jgi:cell division protein FtsL
MIKFLNMILVLSVLGAAAVMYRLEHATRRLERDIAQLKNQVDDEGENFKLLNAEWSSLVRPERIQKLAQTYLKLQFVSAEQIVSAEELTALVPDEPPVKLVEDGGDAIGELLGDLP